MADGYKTGGRLTGTPNRATANARAAIGLFVERNTERLQTWLDQIAEKDPEKAFSLFQSVIEYHVPKLARTEMTGLDGKDLVPSKIQVEFVNAPANTTGV